MLDYIEDIPRRRKLADDVGTVPEYLWQIATGRRDASPRLAILIDEATNGAVSKAELRPDIFGDRAAA